MTGCGVILLDFTGYGTVLGFSWDSQLMEFYQAAQVLGRGRNYPMAVIFDTWQSSHPHRVHYTIRPRSDNIEWNTHRDISPQFQLLPRTDNGKLPFLLELSQHNSCDAYSTEGNGARLGAWEKDVDNRLIV